MSSAHIDCVCGHHSPVCAKPTCVVSVCVMCLWFRINFRVQTAYSARGIRTVQTCFGWPGFYREREKEERDWSVRKEKVVQFGPFKICLYDSDDACPVCTQKFLVE